MDPLQLLRDYTIRDELSKVVLSENRVDFGDRYTFPRNAITGYKSLKGGGRNYTLDTVLFFLQNRNFQHGVYMRKAREFKVATVTLIDNQDLENYLTGVSERSDYIDLASVEQQAAALAVDEQQAKRQKVADGEAASALEPSENGVLHQIYQRERELRDRNSQLMTPTKDLSKILDILKAAQADKVKKPVAPAYNKEKEAQRQRERERERAQAARSGAPAVTPAVAAPLPIKASGRFERSDMQQAAMVKDMNTLGLNQYGLRQPVQDQRPIERKPMQAPPPPEQASRSSQPSSGHHSSSKHSSNHQSSSRQPSSSSRKPESGSKRIPLIIVPAAPSAKINMYNVKAFLEKGTFRTTEQCKAEGVQRLPLVVVQRTTDRKQPVHYHVTDKIPSKTSSDWERVAAVFVQGVGWQFKDFPEPGAAKGDMVDTFIKYLGVYLHFHNEVIPDVVKKWKVERLMVHRENRNNDAQLMRNIWRKLDEFLSSRRSKLAY